MLSPADTDRTFTKILSPAFIMEDNFSINFNPSLSDFTFSSYQLFTQFTSKNMEKWQNSVIVITGAGSGIGLAILRKIAETGLKVVGMDVKLEAIENLKIELKDAKIFSWFCDVANDESTENAFNWVEKNVGHVDVLINSAGIHRNIGILDKHKTMAEIGNHIDVNFTGAIRCSRLIINSLEARKAYGYIININCVYGHYVLPTKDVQLGIFGGTKFAVKATSDVMRFELNRLNNRKVKITNLAPGICSRKLSGEDADNSPYINPVIKPDHIANTVIYLLATPHEITITDLSIKATGSDL
jgi:NADP+-dependent farnesol dehydrogenase